MLEIEKDIELFEIKIFPLSKQLIPPPLKLAWLLVIIEFDMLAIVDQKNKKQNKSNKNKQTHKKKFLKKLKTE